MADRITYETWQVELTMEDGAVHAAPLEVERTPFADGSVSIRPFNCIVPGAQSGVAMSLRVIDPEGNTVSENVVDGGMVQGPVQLDFGREWYITPPPAQSSAR